MDIIIGSQLARIIITPTKDVRVAILGDQVTATHFYLIESVLKLCLKYWGLLARFKKRCVFLNSTDQPWHLFVVIQEPI
jgi:hypothetical protein